MADLAGVYGDGRARIERPTETRAHRLIDDGAIARDKRSRTGGLGHRGLEGLHAPTEGTTNQDSTEQSEIMVVHVTREPHRPRLVHNWPVPEIDGAPIRQRQRHTKRRQPFIAIEQVEGGVASQHTRSLRHEEVPSRRRIVDIGADLRDKVPLHIRVNGGL